MYTTDTHALLWHLQSGGSRRAGRRTGRLSPRVRRIFAAADAGEDVILIPSIVLVELVFLSERGAIPTVLVDRLLSDLGAAPENYRVVPLDLDVVNHLREIPAASVPEMPDRVIAATARATQTRLISRDERLASAAGVAVVW